LSVTRVRNAEEFALRAPNADLRIVIAHSEEGGARIVFPGGQRVALAELKRSCERSGGACLVVTCHSRDLGLSSEISLRSAANAVADTMRRWEPSGIKPILTRSQSDVFEQQPRPRDFAAWKRRMAQGWEI